MNESNNDNQIYNSDYKSHEQGNFIKGILFSVIAGVVAASLWAIISVLIERQFVILVVAIGAFVGIVMKKIGQGSSLKFGIAGGIIAAAACILGDFLTAIAFLAKHESLGYFECLELIKYQYFFEVASGNFDIVSLSFYGLAALIGFGSSTN